MVEVVARMRIRISVSVRIRIRIRIRICCTAITGSNKHSNECEGDLHLADCGDVR